MNINLGVGKVLVAFATLGGIIGTGVNSALNSEKIVDVVNSLEKERVIEKQEFQKEEKVNKETIEKKRIEEEKHSIVKWCKDGKYEEVLRADGKRDYTCSLEFEGLTDIVR